MKEYADLEISLHHHEGDAYAIEFRYTQPKSDADIRLGQGETPLARFDFDTLRSMAHDPVTYGATLTQGLFADPTLLTAFAQARSSAASLDAPLRLRLLIGASAPELHGLRWETLRDPADGSPLATGENLLFSRYLSSLDWRPVRLRPKGELHTLAFVANPSNLAEFKLEPIDVQGELERARAAFAGLPFTALPEPNAPASLNNLIERLRPGMDILYIACHGTLKSNESWLWLEDEAGNAARVPGSDLVTRLKELDQRPRLVVLASCESAAPGEGDALAALGPRLAEAGVPAVIAMQDNISMETIVSFMPVFFSELLSDGQIDRALSVARGAVRQRADYWMPALFMRLRSGRIWYIPGFGGEQKAFEKWPTLIRSIARGLCTPILGSGLAEPIMGSQREIAQRWAETYHYPMAPHERESLPQVAQYLAVNQDRLFLYDELGEYLRNEIKRRHSDDILPELLNGRASLNELIEAVGAKNRQQDPGDSYRALAGLPLPIYITTNPDTLLASALKEAGKDPQIVLCPWNEYIEQSESIYQREPDYFPTPERPLVYHLFGRLDESDSVVLTEDDYFDFLIGVTSNKDLIPSVVRRALIDTSLLFLGFQMDEWNFRVLFRSILTRQGGSRRDLHTHIAAQIDPEEGRILEPERARRFLENYFSKGADINIFWGSAQDFLRELLQRWSENK